METFWDHLETSLKNLKTDYIDLYQFHTPSFCPKPGDETGLYEVMLEAKAQGKSGTSVLQTTGWMWQKKRYGSGLYETLQFPFCYLATEKDLALVKLCREYQVGFIAMKGLSSGLLTRSDAAYAWLDQFDNVLPIWGVQRQGELDEFIHYFNHPPAFTGEIRKVIEKDRQELIGNFCRACGYCMPCPMGFLDQFLCSDVQVNSAQSVSWMA